MIGRWYGLSFGRIGGVVIVTWKVLGHVAGHSRDLR